MACELKLIAILFCTWVANLAYAVIAPFLPGEFVSKDVPVNWIGPIFAIYSLAVIVWSPFITPKLYVLWVPSSVITCGMIGMGTTFILLGLTDYITNPTLLIVFSLACRFC